jgi:hypothetical protein
VRGRLAAERPCEEHLVRRGPLYCPPEPVRRVGVAPPPAWGGMVRPEREPDDQGPTVQTGDMPAPCTLLDCLRFLLAILLMQQQTDTASRCSLAECLTLLALPVSLLLLLLLLLLR